MSERKDFRKLLDVFVSFLKIGAFTFGSGYAMITLIQKEINEKHGWLTDEEVLEIIAVAESTPGPITINTATFVGYKIAGLAGSLLATIGVIIPSFVIIISIFHILKQFGSNIYVQYAFNGVRIGVVALIVKAFWIMFSQLKIDPLAIAVLLFSLVMITFAGASVLTVILCCVAAGVILTLIENRKEN